MGYNSMVRDYAKNCHKGGFFGARTRDRTWDHRLKRPLLFQLSYARDSLGYVLLARNRTLI